MPFPEEIITSESRDKATQIEIKTWLLYPISIEALMIKEAGKRFLGYPYYLG